MRAGVTSEDVLTPLDLSRFKGLDSFDNNKGQMVCLCFFQYCSAPTSR